MDYSRKVVGAVGVAGFTYTINSDRALLIRQILLDVSRGISSFLGYSPDFTKSNNSLT